MKTLAVILLIAIGASAAYFYVRPVSTPIPVAPITTPDVPESSITSVDAEWNKYTDNKLGFSINIPKVATTLYGSCVRTADSFRPKEANVPVKTFQADNSVYIDFEYQYKLTDEVSGDDGISRFSGCEKTATTVYDLSKERRTWNILAKDVINDQELEAFIKQRFGNGCLLGEKTPASQSGVFDVKVKGDGKDLEFTACPINFMYIIKYAPDAKKAFTYDRGQSFKFPKDADYSEIYDEQMSESFTVLFSQDK